MVEPNLTYEQKCERLGDLLETIYERERGERGRHYSLTQFSRSHGFHPASMSQWINKQRIPEGENLIHLEAEFGRDVLVALGIQHSFISQRQRALYELTAGMSDAELEELLEHGREISQREQARGSEMNPHHSLNA